MNHSVPPTEAPAPSRRLSFVWKVAIAAAAIGIVAIGVRELPRLLSKKSPVAKTTNTPAAGPVDYAEILRRVREIVASQTATLPGVVVPTMPLADLGIDPLTRLEVADTLEAEFQVRLTAEELDAAQTVEDLARLVAQKKGIQTGE